MHKNILLIENDIELIEPITTFLQNEGYHIISANKGRNGLKLFSIIASDIVVVDFTISDMDGLDVILKLRELKNENEFFIIPIFANNKQVSKDYRVTLGALRNVTTPLIAPYMESNFEVLISEAHKTLRKRQIGFH